MGRGRPTEAPAVAKEKWVLECYDVPTKPELGWKTTYYFDKNKNKNGCWRVETTPPKGWKAPKIKPQKGKAYNKMPVVMVFKTSNRLNAKTKMKIWKNENIDYILTAAKLPGVPDKAIILEIGVGESFIKSWQSKYNL
jgi:hypothetical protein